MFKRMTILIVVMLFNFLFTNIACSSGGSKKNEIGTKDASQQEAPVISYPEPEYDFGRIPQKAQRTHIFKVRNTGTAPLKIISTKAS